MLSDSGPRRGVSPGLFSSPLPITLMVPTQRLLLIDDDARLAAMVGDYLRNAGFEVDVAATLAAGRERLHDAAYDALLLDLMLPDGDGLEFTRTLRGDARTRRLPLLMLTARGEPMDRSVGLELGADDYLGKPFEPRELLARVKALLRRAQPEAAADEVLRFGRLGQHREQLELVSGQVAGLAVDPCLTRPEIDFEAAGRVLSRDQIMDALRGHPMEAFDRSIDVHVSRIRAAIEEDPKNPQRVLTVRGVGYLFAKRQDAGPDA